MEGVVVVDDRYAPSTILLSSDGRNVSPSIIEKVSLSFGPVSSDPNSIKLANFNAYLNDYIKAIATEDDAKRKDILKILRNFSDQDKHLLFSLAEPKLKKLTGKETIFSYYDYFAYDFNLIDPGAIKSEEIAITYKKEADDLREQLKECRESLLKNPLTVGEEVSKHIESLEKEIADLKKKLAQSNVTVLEKNIQTLESEKQKLLTQLNNLKTSGVGGQPVISGSSDIDKLRQMLDEKSKQLLACQSQTLFNQESLKKVEYITKIFQELNLPLNIFRGLFASSETRRKEAIQEFKRYMKKTDVIDLG